MRKILLSIAALFILVQSGISDPSGMEAAMGQYSQRSKEVKRRHHRAGYSKDEQALLDAAAKGNHRTIRGLLKKGVNPDVRLGYNRTLLMALLSKAAVSQFFVNQTHYKNAVKTAHILIHHGASLVAVDEGGETPLFFAVRAGDISVVKFMLKKHASVNHRDNKGNTPLSNAKEAGNKDIARLLERYGAR